MVGIDGPNTSASSRPTLAPWRASASARLTATVDLPTPPLPAATATTFLGPLSTALSLGAGTNAVTTSGITVTRLAPSALIACSSLDDELAALGQRIGVGRHVDPDQRVVALDLHAVHHPVADDVVAEGRVDDLAQCLLDGCFGDHRLPLRRCGLRPVPGGLLVWVISGGLGRSHPAARPGAPAWSSWPQDTPRCARSRPPSAAHARRPPPRRAPGH